MSSRPDHHEAQLLLAIVNERWDQAIALTQRAAPQPEAFVELARSCDIAPFLHARLAESNRFAIVGETIQAGLAKIRHKTRLDNLLLLARVEQALDLLLGAGIVPIGLKGVDLIHRLYSSFDERTLDDVDLLVAPEQAHKAFGVLEAAGWKGPPESERTHYFRSSFELPLESPGPIGVRLEIHWGLGQDRRYRIDTEAVIGRALPHRIADRPVLRLEDHDAAAHLLIHHIQHFFDRRLKWGIDLRRIAQVPGFDWQIVASRLRAWSGSAAAGLSLLHLRKLMPGTFDVAARALPASLWRQLATLPLRSPHPLDLFRARRRRFVQLMLAAAALENPLDLPGYVRHRAVRERD